MRKVFFDEQYQNLLMEKGFITIPMLSNDEVSYLSEEFGKLRPEILGETVNDGIDLTHCTIYDSDLEYRRKADRLIREVFSSHISRLLVDYRIQACNFFVKPPWKGKVNAHLHPYMLTDFNDTIVTFWCPLVDADESNGTLQVIEKSHKILPEIPVPCAAHSFTDFEDILFEKYLTPISLKAGNSLVFDDTLIHGSEPNNTPTPRLAVQVTCMPNNVRPVFFYQNRDKPDNDFDLFEINSETFVEYGFSGLMNPPENLKKVGTVKNTNRPLLEKEFAKLLETSDEIRQKIYFPGEITKPTGKSSGLTKIKDFLGF